MSKTKPDEGWATKEEIETVEKTFGPPVAESSPRVPTLSSHRGPFRLAIYDKDDELVTVWIQVKVDGETAMAKLLAAAKAAEKFIYDGLHGGGISALAGGVTLKALKQAIAKAEGKE